jgi:hypothetical protein
MSMTSTNVHNVTGVSLQVRDHGYFINHEFTFTCEDGSRHTFCAFSDAHLTVTHLPLHVVPPKPMPVDPSEVATA